MTTKNSRFSMSEQTAARAQRSAAGTAPTVGADRTSGREFTYTSADFERIRVLIHDHAGIVLSSAKQDMVYGRLARRLRARGLATFSAYIDLVLRDRGEWEAFVNALTTNLTSFFREAHHFQILAERMRASGTSRFSIWCCAASTGEEPYSLAITACETFASLQPPVSILATDLNTSVIEEARSGLYAAERLSGLTTAQLQRYFVESGSAGARRIRPELQRLITFGRLNLLEPMWSARGPFDAIFCRNVMIYFDKVTQFAILKRFGPLLRPEGVLVAGHSESFAHASEFFKPLGRTVYART